MTTEGLKAGLELTKLYVVEKDDTAQEVKSGGLPVLATPVLVAWMEQSAYLLPELYLSEDETTVGVQLDVRHTAPSPVGMKVTIRVVLAEVNDRTLVYKTEARDEVQKIAEGLHTRVIVNKNQFMDKVDKKKNVSE